MVLGVQWLETLGKIKWDFKQLRMEFEVEGKKLVLRGGASAVELKTVTMEQMDKLLPYSSECSLVQLCSLHLKVNEEFHCFNNGVTLVNENKVPEQIEQLLQKYGFLFKEPTQLLLHRRHDHRIPLKERVNAVSIRPYKHSTLQNDVVEKMTKELLDVGFIQPSNSPFSSPVVLVKKKNGT